ncbi:MAG: glycoside hydrolase family 28 protein [Cyclobacteriaceae bacterium]
MKLKIFLILLFLVNILNAQETESSVYENIEFDMPRVAAPVFPDYEVNVADFGGVGDGVTKNTEAFSTAIDALTERGGGKLVVPRGIWLTGPITLKSNINLFLDAGALLLFSEDFDDYPLIATSFEGLETFRCISPINAFEAENISITGSGTIDGSGDAWRPVKKSKMTGSQWSSLLKRGGVLSDDGKVWYPSEQSKFGAVNTGNFNVPQATTKEEYAKFKDFLRPVMISIVKSKNVLLDGVTFQNSPAWNIHPLMCENVIIRNLNIRNPWYSQNGDGLDLESCKNALIYNNTFDVGDDAICIKSGKNEDGRKRGMPTENVIVKNNIVYHGHGGFVVGSEMSGGVKNVHVSNCTFMGTDVGLRFKSTRGRGGVVEGIYISDIDMINIPTEPIRFNLFYGGQSPVLEEDQEAAIPDAEAVPVTEETPSFKDIYIKNVTAVGSGSAGYFQGLPEMNLKNINIENSFLEGRKGISIVDADVVTFKNVKVETEKGYPVTLYNTKNFDASGLSGKSESTEGVVLILGAKSEAISLKKSDYADADVQVKVGKEVGKKVVKIKK